MADEFHAHTDRCGGRPLVCRRTEVEPDEAILALTPADARAALAAIVGAPKRRAP